MFSCFPWCSGMSLFPCSPQNLTFVSLLPWINAGSPCSPKPHVEGLTPTPPHTHLQPINPNAAMSLLPFHPALEHMMFEIKPFSRGKYWGLYMVTLWYQTSHIPWSKQASICFKLANIPIINFPEYSTCLKVTQVLSTESHIPEIKWIVSYIPGSKTANILYPFKPLYKPH